MKVKKSVVFAAALACGILLAVPLGAAAASNYRMAENGPATREESARLNRTFLYLNIEYNDRAPHQRVCRYGKRHDPELCRDGDEQH